jgi:hypothetical protein
VPVGRYEWVAAGFAGRRIRPRSARAVGSVSADADDGDRASTGRTPIRTLSGLVAQLHLPPDPASRHSTRNSDPGRTTVNGVGEHLGQHLSGIANNIRRARGVAAESCERPTASQGPPAHQRLRHDLNPAGGPRLKIKEALRSRQRRAPGKDS